ncbi:MAG TPA: asparaginase [Acidimicrobiales bacterium]|nr:asparaginase [Acidimicrobiales bacterium]
MTDQTVRPRVTVYSLGGTIASTKSDESTGGVTPQLGAADLVAVIPELRDVADVTAVTFRQQPSGDLTFADLIELARAIEQSFDEGVDGVVVTQGTDTLEETAFALDVLVRRPQPVVVTGAMRNSTVASPDGSANVLGSVRVAASSQAKGLGTLVVFSDEIHAARFVRKTHTSSLATFRSPSCGPLGWLVEDRVRVVLRVGRYADVGAIPEGDVPAVALIKCSLGDDARVLDQLASLGYTGVVVEAFGGGHVPARVVASLENLAALMPVVLASRTGSGEVLSETYGFPGSERDLLSRGLISAGLLDGPKARVLLGFILSTGAENASARALFDRVVASMSSNDIEASASTVMFLD